MDMKRFFLYAIVIAALALAGCGGNGGGTAMMPDPDPEPPAPMECPEGQVGTPPNCAPPGPTPEEMALKDAQDAAMAAYMMAMGYVNSAKDYVAMGNARKYADMAKEANDAAQAATTSAMAEEYQMAAETARDQAMDAAMTRGLEITKLANKIINQDAIDNAELEGKTGHEVPAPISNAKRVGAAMAAAAGNLPDTPTAQNPHQGSDTTTATENVASATATHNGTAPKIATTVGGNVLSAGEMPVQLVTRRDFMGTEMVRRVDTAGSESSTYAVVYTDINPPTPDYYTTTTGTATVRTATEITTSSIDADTKTYPAIEADEIPTDGSTFAASFNEDTDNNVPPVEGRFFCATAGACSISVTDGSITSITGYIFQPAKSTAPDDLKQDADYLTWGVWATVPDADGTEDPVPAATVGAFGYGAMPFTVYADLKGKATYAGVAHGLYSAGGMVEQFDADVMLEANFGGATAGDDNLLGAVTGSVSNITAGGMDVEGSLNLSRATITDTTGDTGSEPGRFSGATEGVLGGNILSGMWAGEFFGPAKAVTAMERETEFPATAAGSFGGSTADNKVSILGAFGSWKE